MVAIQPQRHLVGLLGSAGRAIAKAPGAFAAVDELRNVNDPEAFRAFLQRMDLGMEEPAAQVVREAATDEERWREARATLLRSAEQQLADMWSANS